MAVRWTAEQTESVEVMMRYFERFRVQYDKSGVAEEVFDKFNDELPSDLVVAHSQIFEGISKVRGLVEFQRMIQGTR